MDNGQLRYPHKFRKGSDGPEATVVLRRALAAQADGSVVVVQVGFSTNLARLLDSKPDDVSSLDGKTLVRRKVRLLSAMAGNFAPAPRERFKEFNVVTDVGSAKKLFQQWPTPIVLSGFEVGNAILYPHRSIEQDYNYVPHHPVAEAYMLYGKMPYDRPTWDLTSTLYAIRLERELVWPVGAGPGGGRGRRVHPFPGRRRRSAPLSDDRQPRASPARPRRVCRPVQRAADQRHGASEERG